MNNRMRLFLAFEAGTFFVAALIHYGVIAAGFEHDRAAIAESLIGTVLASGLLASIVNQRWTRRLALLVQSFALLGTLVGIFTMIVGVGPQTLADAVYHGAIIAVLVWGLTAASRAKAGDAVRHRR
jgi:hypothetical protein